MIHLSAMKNLISRSLLTLFALACGLASANADLVAHWPLDVDANDASGNGFDGLLVGAGVTFNQPGANAATGSSTSFTGAGHIDVSAQCRNQNEQVMQACT